MSIKSIKLYLSTITLVYVSVFLMSCIEKEDVEEPKELMSIRINEVANSMYINETVKLSVTKDPLEVEDVIVFEVSNNKIATITNDGLLTALTKGVVTVFARNEKSTVYDSISITIKEKEVEIPIEPEPVYYSNSLIDFRASADPSIIEHEGIYYAFVTGVNSKILKSTDLVNWENTDVTPIVGRPTWGTKNAGVWAPDIVKIGNEFIMYYAHSTWGDPDPGIGYATAQHPLGPWTDHGKLFLSSEIGVNNSIDSAVFKAEDGKLYMIWGSFRGIYGIELNSDGKSLMGGIEGARQNKVLLAGYDTSTEWNATTYEAPYVIFRDGYYYLFLSTGLCCEGLNSTYAVRVARSTNPLGPYYDSDGKDMLAGNRGHHVLNGTGRMVGPGHNSVVTDDAGEDWILYHVWDYQNIDKVPEYRTMAIDKLVWDEFGWPSVLYKIPSLKAVAPYIEN